MLLPWCLIWDRHPSFWEASDFQEAAESLTMLDYNGRSLLHKAAMEDDTEILDVSWFVVLQMRKICKLQRCR